MTTAAQQTETLSAQLARYARETAADTGSDYAAAVRMMDDEPSEVAAALGCTASDVQAWVDAELASIG